MAQINPSRIHIVSK